MTSHKLLATVPADPSRRWAQSRPLLSLVFLLAMACALPHAVAQQSVEASGQGLIQGIKWFDANANGLQDMWEPGIPGWTLSLNTGQQAVTDANGHYAFIGLAPGDYVVTEESRPDWRQTYPAVHGQGNYVQTWTALMGGQAGAEVQCTRIEIDLRGNRYISGTFSGRVDFDPTEDEDLQSGSGASFVTKIRADHSYAWTKTFWRSRVRCSPTSSGDRVAIGHGNTVEVWLASGDIQLGHKRFEGRATIGDLCFDANGHLFVAGSYDGTVDFDPGMGTDIHVAERHALNCMFLTRFNPDNSYAWTKVSTVKKNSAGALVKVQRVRSDSTGAILVGGSFEGKVYFDLEPHPTELTEGKGDSDAFLSKYTHEGEHLWTNGLINAEENRGYDLCVAPNDEILFVGAYSYTIHDQFSQIVLPDTWANIGAGFVVKYASTGTLIWAHGLGETDHFTAATGLAVTPTGDVIVAVERMPWVAYETSTVDVSLLLLDGTTTEPLWEQRYDAIARTAHTWAGPDDTEHNPSEWGVAINGQGDLLVGGHFTGLLPATDHGGGPLGATGAQDGFVSKFDVEVAGYRLTVSEGTAWIDVNFGSVYVQSSGF